MSARDGLTVEQDIAALRSWARPLPIYRPSGYHARGWARIVLQRIKQLEAENAELKRTSQAS